MSLTNCASSRESQKSIFLSLRRSHGRERAEDDVGAAARRVRRLADGEERSEHVRLLVVVLGRDELWKS